MDDRQSRLQFHCQTCDLRGDRVDCVAERPGETPGFIDLCPRCQSDDVEVLDQAAADRAAYRGFSGSGGGGDDN